MYNSLKSEGSRDLSYSGILSSVAQMSSLPRVGYRPGTRPVADPSSLDNSCRDRLGVG